MPFFPYVGKVVRPFLRLWHRVASASRSASPITAVNVECAWLRPSWLEPEGHQGD